MRIVSANSLDLIPSVRCFVAAFFDDAHMQYFFKGDAPTRRDLIEEFFTILMSVRLALAMPVLICRDADDIVGVVMGYDTRRLEWPPELSDRWTKLFASQVGLPGRLDAADHGSKSFKPVEPHYYLGAIAVDPKRQGGGVGSKLIEFFCALSDEDEASHGVSLDTGEEQNVKYYVRRGFKLLGNAVLEGDHKLYFHYRERKER
jgi:GNAT superfamily N-acetyltransferase